MISKESKTLIQRINLVFRKILILLLNLALFIPVSALLTKSLWELHFFKPKTVGEKIFLIPKNQSLPIIARELEEAKIISSKNKFLSWIVRLDLDRNIQSGKYRFSHSYTLWQVIKKLSRSRAFIEKITIPEGLTITQVARLLTRVGINPQKFTELCTDPQFIQRLSLHTQNLEGFLFPDTYQIAYGEEEERIIEIMVKRFFQVIDTLQLNNSHIYNTNGLLPGLIIASIVEKESRYHPERPKIAQIFWNRLKEDWRLDSDVTVNYAIKEWDRPLTRKDLKIDSPYNTRRHKGLPPTPICNPGKTAIQAAFFPEPCDYMFFIASGDSKGTSIFTKTNKEHNRIKNELKKNEN